MESFLSRLFFNNWPRKLISLLAAVIIWLVVNQSITETKTVRNVPIRIVNLPLDKTINGLLPNGILNKRITLTLSGTKDVIEDLEPGDMEVVIDASSIDHAEWIVQVTKKNLISLNPSIDIVNHITQVSNNEFVIKMSRLVTAKVPILITSPIGDPPNGYRFLDIWPQKLLQTISGPESEIQKIKDEGLTLTFNLSEISKEDLDTIPSLAHGMQNDEISFFIPRRWKQVAIPFSHGTVEEINDPDAEQIRIDFLRSEFLAVDKPIPIRVFYPLKYAAQINPSTFPLKKSDVVKEKEDLMIFTLPLFTKEISRLFLDVVKDNLELVIVAAPQEERDILLWSLEVIGPQELEDTYVALLLATGGSNKNSTVSKGKKREMTYRLRFREYLKRLSLYVSEDQTLNLEGVLKNGGITVKPTDN